MRFVVIGGDAAGMSAASRVKRKRPETEVVVLEQTYDVSYSACGMPYNIADPERDMNQLVVRKAEVFIEKNGINLLVGHRVTQIDRRAKEVTGVNLQGDVFSFSYDKLLIATGGTPVVPDLPGIDLPQVKVLKNLGHGREIKSYIAQNSVEKAVIIGMGYIALEMCEAFEKRGIAVDMVKPRPDFMPWLARDLAEAVQNELASKGVGVYAGHAVKRIESLNDGRVRVSCDNLDLEADLVLIAVGITPLSGIAEAAGLEPGVSGAISVDRHLRTSDHDIYAAGDCADAYHAVTGQKCWIPLALRANRAGWAVADNVCGIDRIVPPVAGTAVFKVFSLEVARSGLNAKEAANAGFEPVENSIVTRSRAHGQPGSTPVHVSMVADRRSGRLLGAEMVGREGVAHRINAVAVALHNQMTAADFSDTDLAYAPPFGPVWDPLLTAANQVIKKIHAS